MGHGAGGWIALALAALFMLPAAASPTSWERPRGDDGNTGAVGSPPGGVGGLLWNASFGVPVSGPPVVALDRLVVGTADGVLYALDPVTGRILWSLRTTSAISGPPAVRDGIAYVGTGEGMVAVDVVTGTMVWSRHDPQPIVAPPLLVKGLLVAGTQEGRLLVIDPTTSEPVSGWPAIRTDGPIQGGAALAGNTLVVQTQAGSLWGYNATTGKQVFHAVVMPGRSTPALAEGLLWTTGAGGVRAVDPGTGMVVHNWTLDTGAVPLTSPVVSRQRLWTGTDRGVSALDLCTGRSLWTVPMPDVSADLTLAGRFLFATSADGVTHALEADSGREAWNVTAGTGVDPVRPLPAVAADGRLMLASADGNVRAFDLGHASALVPNPLPTPLPCTDPLCHLPSQFECCMRITTRPPAGAPEQGTLPSTAVAVFSLPAPFGCDGRQVLNLDPRGTIEFRTLSNPGRGARVDVAGIADLRLGPTTDLTVLEMQLELRTSPNNLTARLPIPDEDAYRALRTLDLQPGHQHDIQDAGPIRITFSAFNLGTDTPTRELSILAWDGSGWVDLHKAGSTSGAVREQDLVVFEAGRGEGEVHVVVSRPGTFVLAEPAAAQEDGGDGFSPGLWAVAIGVAVLLAATGSFLVLMLSRR